MATSRWERAGISPPHTIVKLKDIAALDAEAGVWRLK
jgi:hypothetical protein